MLSLHSSNNDVQKQLDIIFADLNEDPKKIIIMIKKEILKDQDFDLFQERLEHIANEKNIFRVKLGLKSIADYKNDVDLFIRACSFKGEACAHNHLDIAKRLIKH